MKRAAPCVSETSLFDLCLRWNLEQLSVAAQTEALQLASKWRLNAKHKQRVRTRRHVPAWRAGTCWNGLLRTAGEQKPWWRPVWAPILRLCCCCFLCSADNERRFYFRPESGHAADWVRREAWCTKGKESEEEVGKNRGIKSWWWVQWANAGLGFRRCCRCQRTTWIPLILASMRKLHACNACVFVFDTGNGEQGKAFPLTDSDRVDQAYRENGFNIYISDRISLNRSLPDIRHAKSVPWSCFHEPNMRLLCTK